MKKVILVLILVLSSVSFSKVSKLEEKRYDARKDLNYKVITGIVVSSTSKDFSIFLEKDKPEEFTLIMNVANLSKEKDTKVLNYKKKNYLKIIAKDGERKLELEEISETHDLNKNIRMISFKNKKAREELVSILKEESKIDMEVTLKNIRFNIKGIITKGFKEYYENNGKILLNYSNVKRQKSHRVKL